jgi:rhodanese-related sulfurtransferase
MKKKNILMFFLVLLLVASCAKPRVSDVTPKELDSMLNKAKEVILIDVRDYNKYGLEHIRGAISAPTAKIKEFSHKLDKRKTVIIISETGGKSIRALEILLDQGFAKVYNLVGGMSQWRIWNRQIK